MDRAYATPGFAYLIGFVVPYLLTQIPFVQGVGHLSGKTHLVVLTGIVAHLGGLVLGQALFVRGRRDPAPVRIAGLGVVRLLYGWYGLALACLLVEFAAIGGLPILMRNVETARLGLQINGYVHLLAISLGLASAALLFMSRYAPMRAMRWRMVGLALFGLFLLSLTGNRSDVGIALVATISAAVFVGNRRLGLLHVAMGAGLLALFSVVNVYRQGGERYTRMIAEQLVGAPDAVRTALYPLYMTLTYNFAVLDRLVRAGAEGVSGGQFTFHALVSLLPGRQEDFGTFKNELFGERFYSELTSTYLSNFYVDFGLTGVIVLPFVMALLISALYGRARRDERFVLPYGLVYAHGLILFYVFIYSYFFALAGVVALLLLARFGMRRERAA